MKASNAWSISDDVVMGLRLLYRLPAYLRKPLTLAGCREIVRRRLEERGSDFLDLMRRAVFANRVSPYHALLNHAGCEYGDIARMVRRDGVESALQALYSAGVYLTVDEYKGCRPVVRGKVVIPVDPFRLRNPLMVPHFWTTTSGGRGAATHIPLDMACIRDHAVNMYLTLDARGGARWRNAVWGMPAIGPLLWYSAGGVPAERWFSPLDPGASGLHSRYRWSVRAITRVGRLAGVRVPSLEHVPLNAPRPILRWMTQTLQSGETPHLWTYTSSAVRLCRAAEEAGIDLAGARFTITGEPVTEARLAIIRRVHADAVPDYGSADSGGSASYGCLSPEAPDDVHIFSDLNAVIQADAPPFPSGALLLTSIRPTAPFVFLNVSMGDCATMTDRRCGCPLETLGWRTHLHTIRSFEKLTAGGMTFADMKIVRILEEILPGRFGGGPTDYQLVEELGDNGQPTLRLFVHPSIAVDNPEAVSEVFLEALGTGDGTQRVMMLQLRQGGYLQVERRAPFATPSGKILHLWVGSSTGPGGSE